VIQAYLTLTRKLAGRCTGTYITDLGEFRANPDDWHDRATPLRKEREHGIFNTNVWGQVGVTQFRLSRRCVNGSNYHAVGSPTVYVHRELREEFACWATGCQPLGLYAGPWQPGSD
jgi:hypothetical protein